MRDTVRELRNGEGKGTAGSVGRSVKSGAQKVKTGLGKLKKTLGFTDIDQYDPDEEKEQRRKRARELLGDDEPSYTGPARDMRRDLTTVAPEFRAQVSSGLAAANSIK